MSVLNNVARANLAIVNLIAEPLLKFLIQTQADDVVVTKWKCTGNSSILLQDYGQ